MQINAGKLPLQAAGECRGIQAAFISHRATQLMLVSSSLGLDSFCGPVYFILFPSFCTVTLPVMNLRGKVYHTLQ